MIGRWASALLSLALVGAASAPGPAARQDAWTIVGPGGGGTMRRPAISPHDPRFVVEGCDMTGAYITRDAGESWRMFHLGGVVEAFAFDPSDASVLYAANSVLWRSEDAGRTWRVVFPAGVITRTPCTRATIRSTRAARTRTSRPWSWTRPTRATWSSR